MGPIADALSWSGSGAMLSMFVLNMRDHMPDLAVALDPSAISVRPYVLADEEKLLLGLPVIEYDLLYAEVPPNLEDILTRCLRLARSSGAEVAWFGFEGSFDFSDLLTAPLALQTYAVVDAEGIALATDETLSSKAWADRVVRAGQRLRVRSGP